ncbi:MAG TPA: DUF3426 domain-containing protein, partial [Acidobacteriota bacterium]|nr:DUF3426 domain-containing protein [Acidobacteriota bacterium]
MLTRCPRCETTFRVTPEQLKARHGRVRCGHCQNVFNALDTLIEAPPLPIEPAHAFAAGASRETPEPATDATTPIEEATTAGTALPPTEEERAAAAIAANDEVASATRPEWIQAPGESGWIAAPAESESVDGRTESAPEPYWESGPDAEREEAQLAGAPADAEDLEAAAEQADAFDDASGDTPTEPALDPSLHDEPKGRAWPWAIGAALALVALFLQTALHFRTEISVLNPGAKPLLEALCSPFGCDVPLPHKPELVGIETSNLSPDASGKLALSATLKNRAPFAQQYPNLELTLTDTSDQPLVRRV